jgi:hypothetical protein
LTDPWGFEREGVGRMTGIRRRVAQGLVATLVLCAAAFLVCGVFARPGSLWEVLLIVLFIAMLAALFGALALVAATYAGLRAEMRRYLRRPVLSDQEFATLLGEDSKVDAEQIGEIRALAARCFRGLGGERFYPCDRLEEDLHLGDLAPFQTGRFWEALARALELSEDDLEDRIGSHPMVTFGDLVLAATALVDESKERARPGGSLWDRALDG